MKWMKQHAEKTFSKLAFYLCHPCQVSVHAAFNVYLGVFQPVPIGVSCAKNKIDLTFGCAGLKEDTAQNHFQRIAMESNKTGKQIIKGEYLYYLMKAKFDKHKIFRQ